MNRKIYPRISLHIAREKPNVFGIFLLVSCVSEINFNRYYIFFSIIIIIYFSIFSLLLLFALSRHRADLRCTETQGLLIERLSSPAWFDSNLITNCLGIAIEMLLLGDLSRRFGRLSCPLCVSLFLVVFSFHCVDSCSHVTLHERINERCMNGTKSFSGSGHLKPCILREC